MVTARKDKPKISTVPFKWNSLPPGSWEDWQKYRISTPNLANDSRRIVDLVTNRMNVKDKDTNYQIRKRDLILDMLSDTYRLTGDSNHETLVSLFKTYFLKVLDKEEYSFILLLCDLLENRKNLPGSLVGELEVFKAAQVMEFNRAKDTPPPKVDRRMRSYEAGRRALEKATERNR